MKVALVVPEKTRHFNDACPPLNLGYIASYLKKQLPTTEIRIIDGMANQNVTAELFSFQPNIIGVTATTPQAPEAYNLLNYIHVKLADSKTVIGGIHATVCPEEALEHANIVVQGEGEKTFVDIVNGKITTGIVQGEPIENLDDLPSPAFDLIDMQEYLKHGPPFPNLKHPIISMVTSRGCPYRCKFCWNSFRTSKVRYFSAQRIVDEILFFRKKYGVNSVFFNDDEFLINYKRLTELKTLFDKHEISKWLKWGCQARVQTVAVEQTMQTAKDMGCVVVSPGFESNVPRILSYLKNGTTSITQNHQAVQTAKKIGVAIGGSFIFGTPTETLEEMKQTFKYFKDTQLSFIGVNTIIPYPKTELWSLCKQLGLLPEKIDYERLVPTSNPEATYIVDNAVPKQQYVNFIKYVQRVAWLYTQVRCGRNFWSLAKYRTWWWAWLAHPLEMIHILKSCKNTLPKT